MFTYPTIIRMADTDSAGVLFFGNIFRLIHEAYEVLLEKQGFGLAHILRETDFSILIVHTEADYKSPLYLGDPVSITLKIAHIGQTSFSVEYLIKKEATVAATAKTVHVSVAQDSLKKISLPFELRQILKNWGSPS